jgi:hypothetical protein
MGDLLKLIWYAVTGLLCVPQVASSREAIKRSLELLRLAGTIGVGDEQKPFVSKRPVLAAIAVPKP